MIKQLITFGCLLCFGVTVCYGQEVQKAQVLQAILIEGKVIQSTDKQPVIGATISVKNSKKGAISDSDGRFKIQAAIGDVLIISSIGYSNQEFKIRSRENLVVFLKPDTQELREITVIGYGTQERRDLTGSIGTIKAKDIDKTSLSFDNALNGKLAGVQVSSSSGAPGGATAITIRGITSLSANSNNPLIVIDGVPIYGADRTNNTTSFERTSIAFSSFGGGQVSNALENKSEFERNPLSLLNPNDIESIEVLKDAYATAIYGSRGAAGVILITTKRGTSQKPKINLSYVTTFSNPVNTPQIFNAQQYSDFYNLKTQSNKYPVGTETPWLNKILRTGVTHNVNASISAGIGQLKYFLSLSSLKQDAYIVNQDYKKNNARLNLDYKLGTKIKLGANFSVNVSDNNALNAQSIYRNAILKAPNVAEKTDSGDYYFGYLPNPLGSTDNPLAQAYKDINYVKDNRVVGNFLLEYKPLPWLTFKSEPGIDNYDSKAYSRLISRPDLIGGNATQTNTKNQKLVINNTLTFVKTLQGVHAINGVIGQSFETSREESNFTFGRQFANDAILDINQAGVKGGGITRVQKWAVFSLLARLNYQYNQRYLAGVTYRLDGSSRFNKEQRYIGFPSFSLGWRASEEKFLKDISWIDELKFRGSVGFTGIDGTSGYYGNQGQYILQPNDLQYAGSPILQVKQPNNPYLTWEKTRALDYGIDLKLFHNRIDIRADYYYKKITNLLYPSAVPWYLGYAIQDQNIGDMENRGIELELNTINYKTTHFQWSTNFNISRNTNKILKLNLDGSSFGGAELGYKYFAVGKSAGQFFLYDWAGVNPLTGNPLWNYTDGTQSETPPASLNSPDIYRKPMGDALPDFFGGLTNTFQYKNWKLEAFFNFSYGGQLYNGTKALLMTYTTNTANNLSSELLNYWQIEGHQTNIPKINNSSIIRQGGSTVDYTAGRDSNRFLEDASYIRLKNINLTYNVPTAWLRSKYLKSLSLFVQGNNLLTFTKYSGQDPEVSAFGSSALLGGYDELTLPQSKSYSMGINIGF